MIWGGLTGTGKMVVRRQSPGRPRRLDAVDFFNALTGPELLARTEVPRPEHREHAYALPVPSLASICYSFDPQTRVAARANLGKVGRVAVASGVPSSTSILLAQVPLKISRKGCPEEVVGLALDDLRKDPYHGRYLNISIARAQRIGIFLMTSRLSRRRSATSLRLTMMFRRAAGPC